MHLHTSLLRDPGAPLSKAQSSPFQAAPLFWAKAQTEAVS